MNSTNQAAIDRAAELVSAVEAGDGPWAHAARDAQDIIDSLLARSRAALFPSDVPRLEADAYSAMGHYSAGFPTGPDFGRRMADLHGRALGSFQGLAALIRTPEIRNKVGSVATVQAVVLARNAAEMHEEAVCTFELTIARQLEAADHALTPIAREIIAAHALTARLAAAKVRNQQAAAAALERIETERKAAEEATAMELGRAALAATEEAARLTAEANAAARRSRELRAERLKGWLKSSGLTTLRIGRAIWQVKEIISQADRMTDAQLAMYEAALRDRR